MKKRKKVLSVIMAVLLACLPVAYAEDTGDTGDIENEDGSIPVYADAGRGGCYMHDHDVNANGEPKKPH